LCYAGAGRPLLYLYGPSRSGHLGGAGDFGTERGRGAGSALAGRAGGGTGGDFEGGTEALGGGEVLGRGRGEGWGGVDVKPGSGGEDLAVGDLGLEAEFVKGLGTAVGAVALAEDADGDPMAVGGGSVGHQVGVFDVALLEGA